MARLLHGLVQVQGEPSEAAVAFLKVIQILLHEVQRSIMWGASGVPMGEDEDDDEAGALGASSGLAQLQTSEVNLSIGVF